ncbi:MAG: nitroreductase family protein [Lachnospiraceae bacterium]|nr:nitroreductase family protein [Lachnospiraceae bacterium]
METLACIKTRRSIRRYADTPVTKEEIEKVITAAIDSPSWKNTQTAGYVVVTNPEKKAHIADNCVLGFGNNQKIIHSAPAVIVLTTKNNISGFERDGSATTTKGTHWQSFDAGIAAQTLCLAAHDLGLGTVIMGIYDETKVAEAVELPEGYSVSALIALGHAEAEVPAVKRKELAEKLTVIE